MIQHLCCLVAVLLLLALTGVQAQAPAPPTPDPQAVKPRTGQPWSCEVPVLHPSGTAPPTRLKHVCANLAGKPRTVTNVACITYEGTVRFQPELTGAGPTSILASPLTCRTTWDEGVLNGQPKVATFSKNGMKCATSCTIDFVISNVNAATGVILVISGEYE